MSSARSVAKELIRLSFSDPFPDYLTYSRLYALIFYAQAWSLLLRDSELFPDEMVSVEIGPAVPAIHVGMDIREFWCPVDPASFDKDPDLDDKDEAVFLSYLWAAYQDLSPLGLWKLIQAEPSFVKARQAHRNGGSGGIEMNDLAESFARKSSIPHPLGEYELHRRHQEMDAELAVLKFPLLDKALIWKDCRSRTPSATKP